MDVEFVVVDDLTEAWVGRFVAACHHAVAARGRFSVAISGGRTPLPGFRRLGERLDLPWERVWVTWGDERDVPVDHPDRNERAAREAWLDRVPIPAAHVLAWPRRDDPTDAASAHGAALKAAFGDPLDLDLALLGLGADAHTASLFPGSGAVHAVGTTAVVRRGPAEPDRLTLTAGALSCAREAWVLVAGADKREAWRRTVAAGLMDASAMGPDGRRGTVPATRSGPLDGFDALDALPLLAIRPRERLLVWVDRAAASGTTPAGTGTAEPEPS